MIELGQKVLWNGIEGIIIINPRYQRNVRVSFGSNYGVWMVKRSELKW